MESNGKGVHSDGTVVDHPTSPVVWGESGTNGQHAFFQMLHQGTQVVPVEFVSSVAPMGHDAVAHELLIANMFAQSEALAAGRKGVSSHRDFPGNRPSSVLMLDELTPRRLGSLVAMYEHSVAVQGWLMGVNSFDQFGVELGKELALDAADSMARGAVHTSQTLTHPLMNWFLEKKRR
jgi:glucose-6-phosphate isomerase